MVELKIYLTSELNEKFRRLAMSTYGYGRGSLSKAAEEALAKWCTEHGEQALMSSCKVEGHPNDVTRLGVNPDERNQQSETPSASIAGESSNNETKVGT